MKKIILLIFFVFFLVSYVEAASLASCSFRSFNCGAGETMLFRIRGTNSHVETPSGTSGAYSVLVCCSGSNLGNICSGSFDTFLKTSGVTNAHVEKKNIGTLTYTENLCLSTTDSSTVTCGYVTTTDGDDGNQICTTNGYNACVATIKSDTNSHVSTCLSSSSYATKVCCGVGITAPSCGDGAITPPEDCEPSLPLGTTCQGLGYSGGTLSCDPTTCTFTGCTSLPSGCTLDEAHWMDSGCDDIIDDERVLKGTDVCLKVTGDNCDSSDDVHFTINGDDGATIDIPGDSSFSGGEATAIWDTDEGEIGTIYTFDASLVGTSQVETSRGDLEISDTNDCGNGALESGEACEEDSDCASGQICSSCQCGTLTPEGYISFRLAGECIEDSDDDVYGTRTVTIIVKDASGSIISGYPQEVTEDCILGENVPFFTWTNFFLVILLLTGFYSFIGIKRFKYKKDLVKEK